MNTIQKFEEKSFDYFKFLINNDNTDLSIRDMEGNTYLHVLAEINPYDFDCSKMNY